MRDNKEIVNELKEFFKEEFRKQDESHVSTIKLHCEIMNDIEKVKNNP